jgi:hypothetical protein
MEEVFEVFGRQGPAFGDQTSDKSITAVKHVFCPCKSLLIGVSANNHGKTNVPGGSASVERSRGVIQIQYEYRAAIDSNIVTQVVSLTR